MSFLKGFFSLFDWMFPKTYQEMNDDNTNRDAEPSLASAGSVSIGEAQNTGRDEWWCDWYQCPRCDLANIAYDFRFCPDCGVQLQWRRDHRTIDYTRSISSEEWNNMIKQNKTVEEVYGTVKTVTSSQFLEEMLRLVPSGQFQPYAYYNEDMDSIQVYFKDSSSYTQPLNRNVEVHLCHDSNEITGATILNIKRLLNKDNFDAQN